MTPIYAVDGNYLFCEGLRHFLNDSPFELADQFPNLDEFNRKLKRIPDGSVVLLDHPNSYSHQSSDLVDFKTRYPNVHLVVLASKVEKLSFIQCVSAGVDAFLLKNISSVILIESLRLIVLGEKVFPSILATWLIESQADVKLRSNHKAVADANLSKREVEILACLVDGDSNKAIARRLSICDATVKVHIKNILRKVAVDNRTQAAIWALNMGVVGDDRFALAETNLQGATPAKIAASPKH